MNVTTIILEYLGEISTLVIRRFFFHISGFVPENIYSPNSEIQILMQDMKGFKAVTIALQ